MITLLEGFKRLDTNTQPVLYRTGFYLESKMKSLRKQKKRFSLKEHKKDDQHLGLILGNAIKNTIRQQREPVGIMYCRDQSVRK